MWSFKGKENFKNGAFSVGKFFSDNRVFFISALLGTIVFFYLCGSDILNPTNVEWCLRDKGDLKQHYVGWKYFRNAPWSFPPGIINNCVSPFDTSIIFFDAMPIFALIFKAISFLLPDNFQYFGLWGLICYFLQGGISAVLLKKYLENDFEAIISSLFFSIASVVLFRMFGHASLMGSFTVLIGFNFIAYRDEYFYDFKRSSIAWGLLGILCVGIHMYFFGILGIVLLGFLFKEFKCSKKAINIIAPLLSYILCSCLFIYLLGGFTQDSSEVVARGLGHYSFNLNGFFYPRGLSRILTDPKINSGQYEGFAYLGFGIIVLLIFAIAFLFGNYNFKKLFDNKVFKRNSDIKPFMIIFFLGLVVALSPKATIGETVIYEISLPSFIEDLWTTFRASGRFIWPSFYVVMLFSICSIRKYFKTQAFCALIIVCLCLQFFDFGKWHSDLKNNFTSKNKYETMIKNPMWEKIAENEEIQNIKFSNGFLKKCAKNVSVIYEVGNFAVDNNMTTNFFWLAHINPRDVEKFNETVEKSLQENDKSSIYIFDKSEDAIIERYNLNKYEIDGIVVGYSGEL